MKRLGIGAGALSGALLTAPLLGIMYLADQLAGLPFIPYDLFDWITRVLPGAIITFGIDLMIDVMRLVGLSVAGTAKTAEKVMAVLQFFFGGVVTAALFFAVVRLREIRADRLTGLVVGGLVGLPMIAISIAIGGSTVQPIIVVLWLLVLFLAWGAALGEMYHRLNPDEALPEDPEGEVRAVEMIGRRQFLIRLGAATATITVASSGIGNLMAQAARRELKG